jgi:acyl carrier protein
MSDWFDATFDSVVQQAVQGRSLTPVPDDLDLLNLGFDSLAMVQLMLDLDEALGCQVDETDLARNVTLTRVAELRQVFRAYLAATAGGGG